jgi:hypothetical protein
MWRTALVVKCCLLPLNLGLGFTQEVPQRATLKGLRGLRVSVVVGGLEELRNADLRSLLQVDVELRLRQNRIKVLEAPVPGRPVLRISFFAYRSDDAKLDGMAYVARSEVEQDVSLFRNASYARGVTYQGPLSIGLTNSSVFRDTVKQSVAQVVDAFINDFLSENPVP